MLQFERCVGPLIGTDGVPRGTEMPRDNVTDLPANLLENRRVIVFVRAPFSSSSHEPAPTDAIVSGVLYRGLEIPGTRGGEFMWARVAEFAAAVGRACIVEPDWLLTGVSPELLVRVFARPTIVESPSHGPIPIGAYRIELGLEP